MKSVSSHTRDHLVADAAQYRAVLHAVIEGRAIEARAATADLLAGGAAAHAVYRLVARAVLPWAASAPDRRGTSRLSALTAAMSLGKSLPLDEAHTLLIRATGWAAGMAPVGAKAPHALPQMPSTRPLPWTAAEWGARVHAEAVRGDGAAAEWALSLLLAGPDRGTLPTYTTRQTAYTALFAAAAEHAYADWGRLLVAVHNAVEMAERLPPSLTFLALRPALWVIARAAGHRAVRATPSRWGDATDAACALRWNRRGARPGETAEWARALRAGPLVRVVEEALASGLCAMDLLDAAILAALAPAGAPVGTKSSGALSGTAARVVLALHAARRAYALADHPTAPLLSALALLERLPRVPQIRRARRDTSATEARLTITAIARAAAHRATPPSVLFGAAMAREYVEARQRAPDYAALLLRDAGIWLGLDPRGDAALTPAHRAS